SRVLDFVTERVAPQAEREDESTDGLFYTGLAAVSGSDGTPWHATDHDLIRRRARELAEVDPNDGKRVQTLLYQLHVAIARHFAEAELMVSSTWDDAA
ncbi:MAG: hypothetical protein ACXVRH_12310, partial [Thermoleophilaceae bacterium]